jgi:alkylation response protein AidB-like acyl-CoA dehydrogenase
MDLTWPEELLGLQREAVAFAETGALDHAVVDDSWVVGYSEEMNAALGERGWVGMTWPAEYGGGGRTDLERFVVAEALIGNGTPLAGIWICDRQIGPMLLQYGTPEQRRRWLPDMTAGRSRWCIGMSEPGAGSDLANLTTSAVRERDHYVVSGQKVWTSGAANADWCYLICRTDVTARPHEGLSELVVAMDSPGVTVRPIRDATGDSHFCEVFFDEVRVPVDHLVGAINGAFRQTMRQLEHERGGIDRLVSNKGVYRLALAAADSEDARIRQDIGYFESKYAIGRDMVLRNVLRQAPAGYSSVTKVFCTEFEQEVAEFAVRVFGMEAAVRNRVSRNAVYAPAYTIQGGTTGILRNVIGERVLGLPR